MLGMALAFVVLFQDPPGIRFEDIDPGPIWGSVEVGSWTYEVASADGRTLMFSRSDRAPAGRRWFRYEYEPGRLEGVRSLRTLIEADCVGGRTRSVQSEWFSGPNLSGDSTSERPSLLWSYPPPDTFQERQLLMICERGE